ncbi:MAG: class I SAM-dependent methyltransferase [Gemmataceae bacterium]|nr:class I SAM-dependent methyltransferase [Gemmataceae bacterium]
MPAAQTEWRKASKEFFNERAEELPAQVNVATLCYVSGREQRLWTNPALYQDMMDSVREQLKLEKSHSLLEVGCAAGFLASGLAAMVGHYTGVDVAAKALAVARTLGIANAAFDVGDGTRLPYADGQFDRVVCYDVFTNFPQFESVAKVLQDMGRVCRPGGKFMAGSIPDAALASEYQQRTLEVTQELEHKHGPVETPLPSLTFLQRMRRWLTRKVVQVQPNVVCYYFRREDFVQFGRVNALDTQIHDIHRANPYVGYRFNVVYTKPGKA